MVETLASAAETIEAPPSDPASWPTLENVSPAAPASEVASNPFAAPTGPIRVGHYVLLSEVGRGGMGVVHAAYDERLDRKVALKVLRTQGDSWAQRRLVREAQGLARLSHPNVVQIYEIGEVGGHTFLAMEFIDGVTLRRWCSEQPRTRAEILATFLAAGRGLAAAHAKSLIHRDFKPESGPASQVVENTSVPRLRRWYVPIMYQARRPGQDRAARVRSERLARSRTRVTGIGARREESTHHERLDQLGVLRSRHR